MGRTGGLAPEQVGALDRLRTVPGLDGFYLAGGGAVAFHLGHRRSLDVGLFSLTPDTDLDDLRVAITGALDDARVLALTDVALRLVVGTVLIDLVRYPYPLVETPSPGPGGFPVAGLRDLAAMKLAAIARRGIRRDFWDLYMIVTSGLGLAGAASAYMARYGLAQPDLYHVARSLTYFDDAEKERVFPSGLLPETWETIKAFFRAEAPALLWVP